MTNQNKNNNLTKDILLKFLYHFYEMVKFSDHLERFNNNQISLTSFLKALITHANLSFHIKDEDLLSFYLKDKGLFFNEGNKEYLKYVSNEIKKDILSNKLILRLYPSAVPVNSMPRIIKWCENKSIEQIFNLEDYFVIYLDDAENWSYN